MLQLPEPIRERIREWKTKNISADQIVDDEDDFHTTILYGLGKDVRTADILPPLAKSGGVVSPPRRYLKLAAFDPEHPGFGGQEKEAGLVGSAFKAVSKRVGLSSSMPKMLKAVSKRVGLSPSMPEMLNVRRGLTIARHAPEKYEGEITMDNRERVLNHAAIRVPRKIPARDVADETNYMQKRVHNTLRFKTDHPAGFYDRAPGGDPLIWLNRWQGKSTLRHELMHTYQDLGTGLRRKMYDLYRSRFKPLRAVGTNLIELQANVVGLKSFPKGLRAWADYAPSEAVRVGHTGFLSKLPYNILRRAAGWVKKSSTAPTDESVSVLGRYFQT